MKDGAAGVEACAQPGTTVARRRQSARRGTGGGLVAVLVAKLISRGSLPGRYATLSFVEQPQQLIV
jgi:hypothetical protein